MPERAWLGWDETSEASEGALDGVVLELRSEEKRCDATLQLSLLVLGGKGILAGLRCLGGG